MRNAIRAKERPSDHRNSELEAQMEAGKGFLVCSADMWVRIESCPGALWTVGDEVMMTPSVGRIVWEAPPSLTHCRKQLTYSSLTHGLEFKGAE